MDFLKVSSAVVKVAAWIFLCLGFIGGISIFMGLVPESPRWMGLAVCALYAFFFFFFYLIAKMADLMIKIINQFKKE
ncbi:MAG: hypothetical protein PHS09_04060 [Candidatus Omnitrophica bacterium]|nr:hypothetical protein [Candidatus Omnitrophota bacterium]MDD5513710.1 hypothetical protein [Candidatus Omnitrophota bacterium]